MVSPILSPPLVSPGANSTQRYSRSNWYLGASKIGTFILNIFKLLAYTFICLVLLIPVVILTCKNFRTIINKQILKSLHANINFKNYLEGYFERFVDAELTLTKAHIEAESFSEKIFHIEFPIKDKSGKPKTIIKKCRLPNDILLRFEALRIELSELIEMHLSCIRRVENIIYHLDQKIGYKIKYPAKFNLELEKSNNEALEFFRRYNEFCKQVNGLCGVPMPFLPII